MLRQHADDGWRLLALSWQPEIADKTMTVEDVEAAFSRMRELLGATIEIAYCPHPAGPPICWCRKPLPGLGVVLIDHYQLDPGRVHLCRRGSALVECSQLLRDVVRELHPDVLARLGLKAALSALTESLTSRTGARRRP